MSIQLAPGPQCWPKKSAVCGMRFQARLGSVLSQFEPASFKRQQADVDLLYMVCLCWGVGAEIEVLLTEEYGSRLLK